MTAPEPSWTGARVEFTARPIHGLTLSPAAAVRRLGDDHAVALTGAWAGGGAVLAQDPIAVRVDEPDAFAVLDLLPRTATLRAGVGGGWFGWFAYAAGGGVVGSRRMPLSQWGFHPNVVRYDAATATWFDEALVGIVTADELARRRESLVARLLGPAPEPGPSPVPDLRFAAGRTRAEHEAAIASCIRHIAAGDIYQANICLELCAEFSGDPMSLHAQLIERTEPAFGAYLGGRHGVVASASPELFLRRRGREVLSSPIKGTRPRPEDRAAADGEAARLSASAKERAENVMIVDLVRNDLSRVAEIGSVTVPALLRLEPHPGVWHLVSDVTATLREGVTDADLLRATFPPGSVTGAPKLRALEVIAELEAAPRGVYTGALGYVSPVAGLELSVAIRTLELSAGRAVLGVGGGITAGSQPAEEWYECFDKARPLAAAIGADIDAPGQLRVSAGRGAAS